MSLLKVTSMFPESSTESTEAFKVFEQFELFIIIISLWLRANELLNKYPNFPHSRGSHSVELFVLFVLFLWVILLLTSRLKEYLAIKGLGLSSVTVIYIV